MAEKKLNKGRPNLTIYYQNVRGTKTKMKDLTLSMSDCDFDVVVFSETWLSEDICDAEIGMSDYVLYRKDRSNQTSNKKSGGGVLIAVRNCYQSCIVPNNYNNVEHLFVLIRSGTARLVVGAVYLPPPIKVDAVQAHCYALEEIIQEYPNDNICVLGDYNLPHVVWTSDSFGSSAIGHGGDVVRLLSDCFSYNQLFQVNEISNANGVKLDLVVTRDSRTSVQVALESLLPCDRHHPALTVDVLVNDYSESLHYDFSFYDFKRADYNMLNNYYHSVDWDYVIGSVKNVNTAKSVFDEVLYTGISLYVPVVRSKNPKFPRWFSNELKNLILKKKLCHKEYKITHQWETYQKFSELRSQSNILKSYCYVQYVKNIETNLSYDTKQFWNFINSKKGGKYTPNLINLGEQTGTDGQTIVEIFKSYFQGVYRSDADGGEPGLGDGGGSFSSVEISLGEVFDNISKLDINKGPGPDGISPRFLVNCVYALAKPLYMLFKLSLRSGVFPDQWKYSFITPVFKSGDQSDATNYRPISILSSIPKLFEKIVCDKLKHFIKPLLVQEQHGFVEGRSTATNLILLVQSTIVAMEAGGQVDVVYTDFSKAFDTVNHDILIRKLRSCGFCGSLLNWLTCYLTFRKQFVKLKGFVSSEVSVTSGVPQGSHLGPLLFNVFINDLRKVILFSRPLFFADDLKLFMEIHSADDAVRLQGDLDRVSEWCRRNKMNLNIKKCKIMSFFRVKTPLLYEYNINNYLLERVSSLCDLGIYLDTKLDFHIHYDFITNKCLKLLGFVCRHTRDFQTVDSMNTLYRALVRSSLEYLSCVWSPSYAVHVESIERVQKKYARYVSYKFKWNIIAYGDLLRRLQLQSLSRRREVADICFLFRLVNGHIDCSDLLGLINFRVPPRSTRNHSLFAPGYHRCNYGLSSPIARITNGASNTELDFFNLSLKLLKKELLTVH